MHSCILHLHPLPVSSIVESSLIVLCSPETPWLFSHPQSNLLKSWNDPSLLKWYPALVLMGKDLLFSEVDTNTESEHMLLFVICWRECRHTLHSPRFRVRFGTVFFRHKHAEMFDKVSVFCHISSVPVVNVHIKHNKSWVIITQHMYKLPLWAKSSDGLKHGLPLNSQFICIFFL